VRALGSARLPGGNGARRWGRQRVQTLLSPPPDRSLGAAHLPAGGQTPSARSFRSRGLGISQLTMRG
jgi:hypothetical protein